MFRDNSYYYIFKHDFPNYNIMFKFVCLFLPDR